MIKKMKWQKLRDFYFECLETGGKHNIISFPDEFLQEIGRDDRYTFTYYVKNILKMKQNYP